MVFKNVCVLVLWRNSLSIRRVKCAEVTLLETFYWTRRTVHPKKPLNHFNTRYNVTLYMGDFEQFSDRIQPKDFFKILA